MEHPFGKASVEKLPDAPAAGGGEEFVDSYRCHHPFKFPSSFQRTESNRWTLTAW